MGDVQKLEALRADIMASAARARALRKAARDAGGMMAHALRLASIDAQQRARFLVLGFLRKRTCYEVDKRIAHQSQRFATVVYAAQAMLGEVLGAVPAKLAMEHWIDTGNLRGFPDTITATAEQVAATRQLEQARRNLRWAVDSLARLRVQVERAEQDVAARRASVQKLEATIARRWPGGDDDGD